MSEQPTPEKKPLCWQSNRTKAGAKVKCPNTGVWCWVSGEFGRIAQVLCDTHVKVLRARGWKVHYMLEGDNPKPLAEELEGEQHG